MTIDLLPAVDVVDGQAVRLVQGVAGTETGYGDPLDAARAWAADGAEWLHLVDLDAAFGRGSNAELLASVVEKIDIKVELSGGIRDDASLRRALDTGCRRVNIGTAALEDPAWCAAAIAEFGDRVAVGLDVKISEGRHRLAARGWVSDGGDLWSVLARLDAEGCARYVVTDVGRDGTLTGPNTELLEAVCARTDRPVVASGGVSSLDDLRTLERPRGPGRRGRDRRQGPLRRQLHPRRGAGDHPYVSELPGYSREDHSRGDAVRLNGMGVAVRVIPCLDVDAGRVVKGVNFVDLRDAGDPVEMARLYDAEGADELTFLDVSASSGERETTYDVVRRTAEQVFIPLTVGGGVRTNDDIDKLLRAGADKVGINTAAISRPEFLGEASRRYGSQCIVLSVDARRVPADGQPTPSGFEVTTHGGRRGTGIDALEWAQRGQELGVGGDPPELHGRRRHQGRLRPRDDQQGARARRRPGDRQRGSGRRRALRAGRGGGGRRGARGERVPLRDHADR